MRKPDLVEMPHKKGWYKWWRDLLGNRHFWILIALFGGCLFLQYPQQFHITSEPSVFFFLGLTRHAFERILLLIPVIYAAAVFNLWGGIVSLFIAATIMLPRDFLLSQYPADAFVETIGVLILGLLGNIWLQIYRKEKNRRQTALINLEQSYQQLRDSEQKYRELFENAHDSIMVHDLNGDLIAVNAATENLTGYTVAELTKLNVGAFLDKDSLTTAALIKNRLFAREKIEQPYSQRLVKRDGTEAFLKLTTTLLMKEGKPSGFLHIARDVTEEKRMQDQLALAYRHLNESHERLKESQEQLIQAEKLSSLGQLSASIAHEVNNPLSGILTYDQLLIKKTREGTLNPETALDYLGKMEKELIRCTRLIRNLLDFARQSPPSFRAVNINEVMTRAYELASHAAKLQHIQVVTELDATVPTITADFDQLQQVCTNLILNSIQAMPENGVITLRTLANVTDVMMQVSDTGSGISPENVTKLFTPFFTTKREVKGVGLGLAVSYGIVQRHKGKIEVQSRLGKGTTISVRLPLNTKSDNTENAAYTNAENNGKSATMGF
jgi:PAS domain S-box-containing protein